MELMDADSRNQGASALLKATNDLVVAVGGLDDDVRAFEGRSNGLDASTADQLDTLKANCHATLSNLVTAARNHASASGLSPISLLDAAASHISVVVVEMTKQLGVRQSARYDGEREVEESATWPKQANYPSSAASFGSDQFSRQQSKASSSPQASTFAQRDAQANRSAYDQSSRSNILSSSRNGSTDPSTIARVNGRAPMLSSVNSSRSNGTSPHVGDGSNRMLQRTPSQPEDKPQPGYSSSAASYDNKVFDSPPGREPEEQDSAEQPDSQDGDYADFKVLYVSVLVVTMC